MLILIWNFLQNERMLDVSDIVAILSSLYETISVKLHDDDDDNLFLISSSWYDHSSSSSPSSDIDSGHSLDPIRNYLSKKSSATSWSFWIMIIVISIILYYHYFDHHHPHPHHMIIDDWYCLSHLLFLSLASSILLLPDLYTQPITSIFAIIINHHQHHRHYHRHHHSSWFLTSS